MLIHIATDKAVSNLLFPKCKTFLFTNEGIAFYILNRELFPSDGLFYLYLNDFKYQEFFTKYQTSLADLANNAIILKSCLELVNLLSRHKTAPLYS